MTVTLNLRPELEAGLHAQAQATGMTLEDYLQRSLERQLSAEATLFGASEGTGMVQEDGILIYDAGTALPADFLHNALERSREERLQHLLSSPS